jgi:hypothetical protein
MHDENNWFMLSLGTGRYSDSIDNRKPWAKLNGPQKLVM